MRPFLKSGRIMTLFLFLIVVLIISFVRNEVTMNELIPLYKPKKKKGVRR